MQIIFITDAHPAYILEKAQAEHILVRTVLEYQNNLKRDLTQQLILVKGMELVYNRQAQDIQ